MVSGYFDAFAPIQIYWPEMVFINLIVIAHIIYNGNSNKNSELLNTNSNFVISLTGLLCVFFW